VTTFTETPARFNDIPAWETSPGGLLECQAAYRPHLTDSRQWPTLVSLRRLPPETDWLLAEGNNALRPG